MTDRDFINAITHLLTKYRDQVREETLAEVRRKLMGSVPAQTSVFAPRRRGRPAGHTSQRARIENVLSGRPWSSMGDLRQALPDIDSRCLCTLVSRLVSQGKLSKRGNAMAYEYALPLAVAAE